MFHVKHSTTHYPLSAHSILTVLSSAGLSVDEHQAQQLADNAEAVLAANQTMNLTRIVDPLSFLHLHILDSLMPMTLVSLVGLRVLDVGSGAGFPGLPLAIMGLDVTCCEARRKKADVISSIASQIGVDVRVVPQRAEELSATGEVWDVVVMRAVSSLSSLVELAAPLLANDGVLLAMKGLRQVDEETRAVTVCGLVGMRLREVHEYRLPAGEETRTLYVYERVGEPKVSLPRRSGLAQTQPLA
ncbi:MAG: 16S rRNA (guanine(527)-N(7))-methyltransferase RsmG [Coriobacteriia bacterium]|nr:16S rRNA (guanine(527)-N(7))-methyltransferase RsmG [Coriobacteriia bacterium]